VRRLEGCHSELGAPREQAARFLTENYSLDDPEGLLDEVYSSVER
jgi:hypothetical protein